MTVQHQPYRIGIRKVTAIAAAVAAATAVTQHDLPATRTGIIRKVTIMNNNVAQTIVQFGTGLAGLYAQSIPGFVVPAGMDRQLTEDELPALEFTADITMQASAAGAAPANVQVLVEVEEFLGASG